MIFKIIRLIFLIIITSACPLRSLDLLNRPIIILNSTSSNTFNETTPKQPYRYKYDYDYGPSRVEDFGFDLEY